MRSCPCSDGKGWPRPSSLLAGESSADPGLDEGERGGRWTGACAKASVPTANRAAPGSIPARATTPTSCGRRGLYHDMLGLRTFALRAWRRASGSRKWAKARAQFTGIRRRPRLSRAVLEWCFHAARNPPGHGRAARDSHCRGEAAFALHRSGGRPKSLLRARVRAPDGRGFTHTGRWSKRSLPAREKPCTVS